jgi:hypothetical protein
MRTEWGDFTRSLCLNWFAVAGGSGLVGVPRVQRLTFGGQEILLSFFAAPIRSGMMLELVLVFVLEFRQARKGRVFRRSPFVMPGSRS